MSKKTARRERFFQKLSELEDRIEFIEKNLGEREEFLVNRIKRKAMYKEFQELAEISADLSAMLVKDSGKCLEDDYSNLEKASSILGLDEDTCYKLKKGNGLRNVLVHEYNGVIDKQAYESIHEVLLGIKSYASALEKWLKG